MQTLLWLLLMPAAFGAFAEEPAPRISLVTAAPGPEIFELYGHEAVRVVTPQGADMVYNFGLFDFNAPNFVYRFVKGETDYMAGVVPTSLFLGDYERRGSQVVEQELNLTPAEARKMAALLDEAVSEDNYIYRYRYCTNNCATRIVDIMEASLSAKPQYADVSPDLRSYRDVMRRYDSNYPWYVMGVDAALGSGIDKKVTPRERMYVPMELRSTIAATSLSDGRKLVKKENLLVEGRGDVTLPPTPLWLSPLFWAWLLLLATLLIVYRSMRRGWKPWRWWLSLWFAVVGIAGCVSMFLIFVSEHEATSPNILGWWLNPLWLVAACTIWFPRARRFTQTWLTMLSVMCGTMLLAWNLGAQQVNMPLVLLCSSTLVLSVSYALTGASTHRRAHRQKP